MSTVRDVARVLLGTWPTQVAAWGEDGLQAYLSELKARGVSPEQAIAAIRGDAGGEFPPSAAKLAVAGRGNQFSPACQAAIDAGDLDAFQRAWRGEDVGIIQQLRGAPVLELSDKTGEQE